MVSQKHWQLWYQVISDDRLTCADHPGALSLNSWSPPQPNGRTIYYYYWWGHHCDHLLSCLIHAKCCGGILHTWFYIHPNHPSRQVLVCEFCKRKCGQQITWPKVALLTWSRKRIQTLHHCSSHWYENVPKCIFNSNNLLGYIFSMKSHSHT